MVDAESFLEPLEAVRGIEVIVSNGFRPVDRLFDRLLAMGMEVEVLQQQYRAPPATQLPSTAATPPGPPGPPLLQQ